MAQLTDDCFAFSGPMLPVDELEKIVAERVTPVAEIESLPLGAARGRVVARDVPAPIALPSFDNSAVDGYAVRHADLNKDAETRLAVVDRVTAGRSAAQPLSTGQAIRIFTGAPMPPGADTVFMQEDVRVEDGVVIVPSGLQFGANCRLVGEDVKKGSAALPMGRLLSIADVALASALGLTELPVRRRIRVALFSTGDELIEPGKPLKDAALYDANRQLLTGLIASLGATVTDLGILHDDPSSLADALRAAAANHDLIVTSGGVSTGEADYVRDAVEKIGKLVFWRVAIKPGRPVAMGVIGNSAFVGLPGNPVAAFVTFVRVVRPLILRLSGALPSPLVALPVRAGFAYRKKKGRREYVRVALKRASDGIVEAFKHPQEGAGVITSLTETDGLVELSEDTTNVEPGAIVAFLPYAVLTG
jgi:molybdopterin molybdotransferase